MAWGGVLNTVSLTTSLFPDDVGDAVGAIFYLAENRFLLRQIIHLLRRPRRLKCFCLQDQVFGHAAQLVGHYQGLWQRLKTQPVIGGRVVVLPIIGQRWGLFFGGSDCFFCCGGAGGGGALHAVLLMSWDFKPIVARSNAKRGGLCGLTDRHSDR